MKRGSILLLENIHHNAMTVLEEAGFEVDLLSKSLAEDELIKALRDCVAVGVRSKTYITERVLRECPKLRAIGAFCIGTNQIDLHFANGIGVPAFNAPFSNTRSVAELIIAEIVFLARKMGDRNNKSHSGYWYKSSSGCHEVRGKHLGIIGYGHIGRQVGVLAEAFGMKVRFYDIASRLPMGNNVAADGLDDVLENSDFVTLHVPATPETEWMIGAKEIAKMKRGSYLLNLSRGNVVVLEALRDALNDGHLAGAAVDVYPAEPKTNDEPFENPLMGCPNTLLSPHIGGSTEEAQVSIADEVSSALIRFFDHGITAGAVNFPQADLQPRSGADRIMHAHKNIPGVLGDVHHLAKAAGANVLAQMLVTDEQIGYLLMDVEAGKGGALVDGMRDLETTVRVELLGH